MVVCKFFQQGSCRYGSNCRFEHVYGSKYSYHASAPAQATPSTTDEQLLQQVHSDVQAALRGGQWLLSCYAPFKEKREFPGINDLSFEEARLFIYEAKANNNLEQAVSYINDLCKEARAKYEQLLQKNPNITRALRSIYNGESIAFSFGNMAHSSGFESGATSSVFRSAIQTSPFGQNNQTPSIFSQNNPTTVFGQNNATPSIFAQTTSDPAKSIFAQANQGSFNQSPSNLAQNPNTNTQNIFGHQPDAAQSIFAQASQNAFISPTQNTSDPASIFANASQSVFAQNQQPSPFSSHTNPFSQNAGPPGTQTGLNVTQNAFQPASKGDSSVYSNVEDVSVEHLEAFNSSTFKMGFVPEIPPPYSLCV